MGALNATFYHLETTVHALNQTDFRDYCNILYENSSWTVDPECCCPAWHWNGKAKIYCEACPSRTSWLSVADRVRFKMATLVHRSMSSVSLRRLPTALICGHPPTEIIKGMYMLCQTIALSFWRPKFCHICSMNLEQLTVHPQESGAEQRVFQVGA